MSAVGANVMSPSIAAGVKNSHTESINDVWGKDAPSVGNAYKNRGLDVSDITGANRKNRFGAKMNIPSAQVGLVAGMHRNASVEGGAYRRPQKNESSVFSHLPDDPSTRQPLKKRQFSEQRLPPSSVNQV